jgi:rare lipoprotein A
MAIIGKTTRYIRPSGRLLLCMILLIGPVVCSTDAWAPVRAERKNSVQVGLASWYGHPHHGRVAASGQVYDMNGLTAAHRTLPFGTVVRVQNLRNNRTVKVEINDRGPFIPGRIIDLSRAAARALRMEQAGLTRVRITIVKTPDRLQG